MVRYLNSGASWGPAEFKEENMPASETSKKITKVIKLADKLIQDTVKGLEKLQEAAKELKDKDEPGGVG